MEKIVIATTNAHKLVEIKAILEDFNYEILSLEDVNLQDVEIVEDGETYEANSVKKAREIMKLTGLNALADDSGLEVDALEGAPGVYSARFSGENATAASNNALLLEKLKDVPKDKRTARFVSVISIAFTDGRELVVRGTVEGEIGYQLIGGNGFGYDPLFYWPKGNCTFAELSAERKNQNSHRARALEALREALTQNRG